MCFFEFIKINLSGKKLFKSLVLPEIGYFLFSFFLFFEVYIGKERFVFRDLMPFSYPMGGLLKKYFLGEGSILWDNTINHGMPFLARYTPAAIYPTSFLFYFFEVDVAISISIILHLIVASSGMYRLLKFYKIESWISWLGGLAFGFGGYALTLIGSWIYLFGYSLLPLSILAVNYLIEKQTLKRIVFLAIVFSLQIIAAEPQILFYEIFFLIPLVILFAESGIKKKIRATTHIFFAGLLSLCISFFQVLPTLEFSKHSVRSASMSFLEISKWSFNPIRIIEYIVPGIWGNYSPNFTFWGQFLINPPLGAKLPWSLSIYVGFFIVLGMFFLSFKKNKKDTILWLSVTILFFLFAVGKHFPLFKLFYYVIPGVGSFRYPEKFISFVSFGLIILGSIGLNNMVQYFINFSHRRKRNILAICFMLTAIVVLIVILFFLDYSSLKNVKFFTGILKREFVLGLNADPLIIMNDMWFAVFKAIFIITSFLILFLLMIFRIIRNKLIFFLMILVFILDIFFSALPLRGTARAKWLTSPPKACDFFNSNNKNNKYNPFIVRLGGELYEPGEPLKDAYEFDSNYERGRYFNYNNFGGNIGVDHCIHQIQGYESAQLREWNYLFDIWFRDFDRAADIMGINYLIKSIFETKAYDHSKYKEVKFFPEYDLQILSNSDQLTYLVSLGEAINVRNIDKAIDVLMDTKFDFRKKGVFQTDKKLNLYPHAKRQSELTTYEAGKIEAELGYDEPGYLIILESHYPGWKAKLNGMEVVIYKANGSFMGIEVPKGKHELQMVFDPIVQKIGNRVSFSFILLIIFLLFLDRNKK